MYDTLDIILRGQKWSFADVSLAQKIEKCLWTYVRCYDEIVPFFYDRQMYNFSLIHEFVF